MRQDVDRAGTGVNGFHGSGEIVAMSQQVGSKDPDISMEDLRSSLYCPPGPQGLPAAPWATRSTSKAVPLRLVIADDHPIFLDGVRALLQAVEGVDIVEQAISGAEALRHIVERWPEIAIVEIAMSDMNGIALIEQARAAGCPTQFIVLSARKEHSFVEQALAAGARGYLPKHAASAHLLHAIRAVRAGGLYLDPSIVRRHVTLPGNTSGQRGPRASEAVAPLTEREKEVVRLIAFGFTNKEVAAKLGITPTSVETYKARATDKLGLASRAKLVRYALLQGWLSKEAANAFA